MAATSQADSVLSKTVFENFTITKDGKQISSLAVEKEVRLTANLASIQGGRKKCKG